MPIMCGKCGQKPACVKIKRPELAKLCYGCGAGPAEKAEAVLRRRRNIIKRSELDHGNKDKGKQ